MMNTSKHYFRVVFLCFLMLVAYPKFHVEAAGPTDVRNVDICVYGGTASGVIAAYSAKKMGKTVLLIEPEKHLGGMTTSGLGFTDVGQKDAVAGLSRLFYRKVGTRYNKFEEWNFPPSIAASVIKEFVDEGVLDVEYFRRIVSATTDQGKITSIILEDSNNPGTPQLQVNAKVFIDCTYEGDLMARAGVSYAVGRESNATYGETKNGVQLAYYHQFPDGVDPYKVEGDPTSGLCWGVVNDPLGVIGQGDNAVQAYNYRLCLTKVADNKVPFTRPDTYNREQYELLARAIKKMTPEKSIDINSYFAAGAVPGNKYDVNNRGAFSTNMVGMNHSYPNASYAERKQICKAQQEYIRGLFYFLTTDEAVPVELQNKVKEFGWAKDEFTDNNYFPHQIYVREARRMIGEYVMTQKNCERTDVVADGVGLASYAMDSHNCRRIIVNGMVKNEGDVEIGLKSSFPISYRSIVPKRSECQNLLVPVCVSSSHIAYGSIRMEPVFMVLGQSAAVAAAMAIDRNCAVQEVDVTALQNKLSSDPYLDGSSAEVEVGTGTAEDPYQISNIYQLSQISSHLNSHFKLMANIDLSCTGWSAMGSITKPFKGVFDGNGYAISGINIVAKGQFSGFFGVINGGTVKNLWLKDVLITQTATGAGDDLGILAGYGEGATIRNCAVNGTVVGGTHNNIGGIFGRVGGTVPLKVSDCYVDVTVSGNKTIGSVVGATTAPLTMERCFVKGAISSPNRAGAATALNNNAGSSFTGIVATDLTITDSGTTGAGTAMNRIIGDGTVGTYNNNLASTTVTFVNIPGKTIQSGSNTKDGLTKTIDELKQIATYTAIGYKFGTDGDNPWDLQQDGAYPQLWFMNPNWQRPEPPTPEPEPQGYNIIPQPKSITPAEGTFQLTNAVKVTATATDPVLAKVVENFVRQIELTSGVKMTIVSESSAPTQNVIRFTTNASVPVEGYKLRITPADITIESSSAEGAFYGVQSLYQLLPAAVCGQSYVENLSMKVRCGDIQDEPRFAYRGMHLDVARFYMPMEFLKQYIDILALHKINHFHWHLTDNQGWRIEIKQYPKLIEIGSVRSQSIIGHTGKYDGKEHRGHYTQEQAKEIVAYAAERFITVIPEIEMPGHATAALASYPELGCFPEEPHEVATRWGLFTDLMCPKESTFKFLENVLTELFDIFPSPYYHIGGDECSPLTSSWKRCAHCQALIKSEGLADEVALQNYFMNRIATFMKSKNKQIIGWNEILKGGDQLPDNAIVMSWTGGASESVKQKRKVIMTPWQYMYLDYYQIGEDVEKVDNLSLEGFTPLQKVYGYEPVPAGLTAEEEKFVYGMQGTCWREFMPTQERLMYQIFPRILAVAETAWTAKDRKNYDSFRERVVEDYPRIAAKGYTPSPAFYMPVFIFDKSNTYPKKLEMTLGYPRADIRYTLDGSEPTASSPIYTQPLTLPQGTVIKAAAFEKAVQVGKTSGIWFGNNTFFLPGRFENGDGTSQNPYEISNVYQLDEVRNGLTSCYRMVNDLDMKGFPYSPIGSINAGKHFAGTLDGNGHVIENAEVSGGGWLGFFGTCKDCTIKNLYLKNITVEASSDYAGGLVGYLMGGTISNCAVSGVVKNTDGGKGNLFGGLVGLTSGSAKVSISNCHVDVRLDPFSGGSAGIVSVAAMPTEIKQCIINGHFLSGDRTGGAIGIAKSANVQVSGLVVGNLKIERREGSTGNIGWFNRIIGENRTPVALSNNLADGEKTSLVNLTGKTISSGHTTVDGLTKSTAELQQQSTYTAVNYSFGETESTPWIFNGGSTYPILWFMKNAAASASNPVNKLQLKVYPTPCDDVLYIGGVPVVSYELFSMSGYLLKSCKSAVINMSDVPSGSYVLKVKTTQGVETYCVVKK